MNENADESLIDFFTKTNLVLSLIFSSFNIIIIIILCFLLYSKNNNLKLLKYKLIVFIIIDSISSLLSTNEVYEFDETIGELLVSLLMTIEFYIFISFFYQIFNSTEIAQNTKQLVLINPLLLSILFLIQIFSYQKIVEIDLHSILIIQRIIVFVSLILLYKYLKDKITAISNRLILKDIQNKRIYHYLNIIILVGVIFMACNNFIKLYLVFIEYSSYQLYIDIAVNSFSYGFKYFIFTLFAIIIYILGKDYYKNNSEENIYFKNNIS